MSTFRNQHRELSEMEKIAIRHIKSTADALESAITVFDGEDNTDRRCIALARTKLEECVMWAVKGITG